MHTQTHAHKIEFLGYGLNTIKGTIRIPPKKFEKFKIEAAAIRRMKTCDYKLIEKLRGKMCSFVLVSENMRLHIRRITWAMKKANENNSQRVGK